MPRYDTSGFQPIFFRFMPTGLSPSMAGLFRPLWLSRVRRRLVPQLHISRTFPYGIRFGLFPFRSLLMGESLLVSFPPPTEMFQFRGLPLLSERREFRRARSERSHSGIPGSKLACSYPGRFAACRALLRRSSLAILQTAFHVGLTNGYVFVWRCLGICCMGLCMVFIMSVVYVYSQRSLLPFILDGLTSRIAYCCARKSCARR